MPILGAHQSIAGGLHKAVIAAAECGCDCVQLFTGNPRQFPKLQTAVQSGRFLTKNNNQWRAKPIVEDDVARFRAALAEHKIAHPLSHDSYLINMAAADGPLWKQSVDAFVVGFFVEFSGYLRAV